MNPTQDYKTLLTQVIKKQIVILGPDITLAKARNVAGLSVADDGTVLDISGVPQEITQKLIDQFVELSGEIVKKTMEPLLMVNATTIATPQPVQAPQAPQPPVQTTQQTAPAPIQSGSTPVQTSASTQPPVTTPSSGPVANQPIASEPKPMQ